MNRLSCDICMDLMPLVQDGIASDDSTQAVREHIAQCPNCAKLWDGAPIPAAKPQAVYQKFRTRLRLFSSMILVLGLSLGLSLFSGMEMFYNILLMPAIGALGYGIFRWKALLVLPVVLLVTGVLNNFLGNGFSGEVQSPGGLLSWLWICLVFITVGIAIAGLLHFALKKEPEDTSKEGKPKRTIPFGKSSC